MKETDYTDIMKVAKAKQKSELSYSDIAERVGCDRAYAFRAVKTPALVSFRVFAKVALLLGLDRSEAVKIWEAAKKRHANEVINLRLSNAINNDE